MSRHEYTWVSKTATWLKISCHTGITISDINKKRALPVKTGKPEESGRAKANADYFAM
jgi:hypothetical protein